MTHAFRPKTPDSKRLFAAIKLNPEQSLLKTYAFLKNNLLGDNIAWVDPSKLHITLRFFGEIDNNNIEKIITCLENTSNYCSSFKIELIGIGIFGSRYAPRVIWIGIKKDILFDNLINKMFNNLALIGHKGDRQNFVPHLTLARINKIYDKKRFQQIIKLSSKELLQEIHVTEFSLFESTLTKNGANYSTIQSFKLKL